MKVKGRVSGTACSFHSAYIQVVKISLYYLVLSSKLYLLQDMFPDLHCWVESNQHKQTKTSNITQTSSGQKEYMYVNLKEGQHP